MTRNLGRGVLGGCLSLGLSLGVPGAAVADTFEVEGHSVSLTQAPGASLLSGTNLYVVTGLNQVAVFDLSATQNGPMAPVEVRTFDGDIADLIITSGRVWVLVGEVRAVPMGAGATGFSSAPDAGSGISAGPVSSGALSGEVIRGSAGAAVIAAGRSQGLSPGDLVRILVDVPVEVEGIDAGAEGLVREVSSGVGEITVVGESQSQVTLRRGGRASEGDRFVVLTEDVPRSLIAPTRLGGMYEVGFDVRPFLGVNTLGLGSVNEVWASYIGTKPYFAEVRVHPFTMGWSRDGNLIGQTTTAMVGYDNRFYAIGLGGGLTSANTGITDIGIRQNYATAEDAGGYAGDYSFQFEEVQRGGAVAQLVRLGSRDGLHLEVRNTFVLGQVEEYEVDVECLAYDSEEEYYCVEYEEKDPVLVDEYREFRWGSTMGKLVLPVADVTDIVLDVGGGATGFFSVSGGVQSWLRGNGDVGSLSLRVSAGYGFLAGTPDEEYIELQGPLLAFGMRWRL